MFDAYCRYLLEQTHAVQGRYSKEDLRQYVLHLPNCQITMAARDMMLEEVPIIPLDYGIMDWVEQKVLPDVEERRTWAPLPFMTAQVGGFINHMEGWGEVDKRFMPLGLEPCIVSTGDFYKYDDCAYELCDFRFLPLKSYDYRKA